VNLFDIAKQLDVLRVLTPEPAAREVGCEHEAFEQMRNQLEPFEWREINVDRVKIPVQPGVSISHSFVFSANLHENRQFSAH
jgi:hypothetical protein